MIELLSFQWLLAIGIVLIGLETFVVSFFLFPLGVGFVVVSILQWYLAPFDNFYAQIATVFAIALVLVLALRKKFIEFLGKSSKNTEEHIHKGGIGIVDGTQIKFEGTYWNTDDELSTFKDGDKVEIEIVQNKAVIKGQK